MAAAMRTPLVEHHDRRGLILGTALAVSVCLHLAAFQNLSGTEREAIHAPPIAVEIFHLEAPKPPAAPRRDEPPPPKPKVMRVSTVKPVPLPTQPSPTEETKKPENDLPPVVTGFHLQSTTPAGTAPAPVGNTPFGKMEAAAPPAHSPEAWSKNFVPAGFADRDPVIDVDCKTDYPEEARRLEVQGTVRMRITVDAAGKVVEVKPMGPRLGYGLDEAAHRAIWGCKFKPALKTGQPVATSLVYAYTFNLD